jgi:phenylpropionate dioxygenase-like ring-hydroxylating dioxygenase large terminal subunit
VNLKADAREKLLTVAQDILAHSRDDSIRQAPDAMRLPASHYTDPQRFASERDRVFRRLPLLLAASCELPRAGDYKAMEVAGVPMLLVRQADGRVCAFLNGCTHRGASLAAGCGNASRFVCPYHGWTFDRSGELVGIAARRDFGDVDLARLGLKPLPLLEKAGLIWVIPARRSSLQIESFLAGYDELLAGFGFERWHYLDRRVLAGANWKLAFDAHLEFYHLPVLHRSTFGPAMSNRTLYYFWGPHQRLSRPSPSASPSAPEDHDLLRMRDRPRHEWPTQALLLGEWIIFPNVSINRFYDGGQGVILSQVFPGASVGESFTIQTYLLEREPDAENREKALKLLDFLERVVRDEDLTTSVGQQRVLASGVLDEVCFGRNEAGLHHFHRWLAAVLDADDESLAALFRTQGCDDPIAMPGAAP